MKFLKLQVLVSSRKVLERNSTGWLCDDTSSGPGRRSPASAQFDFHRRWLYLWEPSSAHDCFSPSLQVPLSQIGTPSRTRRLLVPSCPPGLKPAFPISLFGDNTSSTSIWGTLWNLSTPLIFPNSEQTHPLPNWYTLLTKSWEMNFSLVVSHKHPKYPPVGKKTNKLERIHFITCFVEAKNTVYSYGYWYGKISKNRLE